MDTPPGAFADRSDEAVWATRIERKPWLRKQKFERGKAVAAARILQEEWHHGQGRIHGLLTLVPLVGSDSPLLPPHVKRVSELILTSAGLGSLEKEDLRKRVLDSNLQDEHKESLAAALQTGFVAKAARSPQQNWVHLFHYLPTALVQWLQEEECVETKTLKVLSFLAERGLHSPSEPTLAVVTVLVNYQNQGQLLQPCSSHDLFLKCKCRARAFLDRLNGKKLPTGGLQELPCDPCYLAADRRGGNFLCEAGVRAAGPQRASSQKTAAVDVGLDNKGEEQGEEAEQQLGKQGKKQGKAASQAKKHEGEKHQKPASQVKKTQQQDEKSEKAEKKQQHQKPASQVKKTQQQDDEKSEKAENKQQQQQQQHQKPASQVKKTQQQDKKSEKAEKKQQQDKKGEKAEKKQHGKGGKKAAEKKKRQNTTPEDREKFLKTLPPKVLKAFAKGCSKCRWRPYCTDDRFQIPDASVICSHSGHFGRLAAGGRFGLCKEVFVDIEWWNELTTKERECFMKGYLAAKAQEKKKEGYKEEKTPESFNLRRLLAALTLEKGSATYIFIQVRSILNLVKLDRAMDPADDSIIADCNPAELAEILKKHWSLENRKELCKHLIDGLGKSSVKPSTVVQSTSRSSGSGKQKSHELAEIAAPFHD
ncbi:unnamed protein product [Symbiodinium sp. CCMP2592]|nr:unnamed protein product [Symbiodinium sp. CCMP2592]